MGRGAKIFWIGFAIATISMFVPGIGIIGFIIAAVMMPWGAWLFWFGAAKGVVKGGVHLAKKASGDKTGSGKL